MLFISAIFSAANITSEGKIVLLDNINYTTVEALLCLSLFTVCLYFMSQISSLLRTIYI
jgi:hypothetical protein